MHIPYVQPTQTENRGKEDPVSANLSILKSVAEHLEEQGKEVPEAPGEMAPEGELVQTSTKEQEHDEVQA